MSDLSSIQSKTRVAGQLVFMIGFLAFSLFLLSQMGGETKWVNKSKLFAQPRFWPAVGIFVMTGFAILHIYLMKRRKFNQSDWAELRNWTSPFEYALWFMGYVWAVPIIGYIFASVIFAPLLCYRVGYRSKGILLGATVFAVVTVIMFKSFLQVRIPGAMIYEYLPDGLRSFFILNL